MSIWAERFIRTDFIKSVKCSLTIPTAFYLFIKWKEFCLVGLGLVLYFTELPAIGPIYTNLYIHISFLKLVIKGFMYMRKRKNVWCYTTLIHIVWHFQTISHWQKFQDDFLKAELYCTICIYPTFFINLSLEVYIDWFHILGFGNNAATK